MRWPELGLAAIWIPSGLVLLGAGLCQADNKVFAGCSATIACLLLWVVLATITRIRIGQKKP
jgi:hypothetical protein